MFDYLLIEDLGREHNLELRRVRDEIHLIAKAERARRLGVRGPHFAGLLPLLRSLLVNSPKLSRL